MGKFNGIVEYHDGLAVSEYMNMLPLGDSCIDRCGDKLKFQINDVGKLRGCFIDSHENIYIAVGKSLYRSEVLNGERQAPAKMEYLYEGNLVPVQLGGDESEQVTFCESSIKPSVVYCCDGAFIYMWNTTPSAFAIGERAPYLVNPQYLPNLDPDETIDKQPSMWNYVRSRDTTGFLLDTSEVAYAGSICWFDNKLVMRQKGTTTVWLTCTDPSQFYRDSTLSTINPPSGIALWNSWYSSTNSSDSLIDIASYGGQLYLLNSHSIEVWGRTGNEDSPIQSNTTQVIHFGGRCPLVVEDNLYLIGRHASGHEFIGCFSGGQFQKITNQEVERRMGSPLDLNIIVQHHENYVYVRCTESSGFLFRDGRWSSWKSPKGEPNPVVTSIYEDLCVGLDGSILEFDYARRTSQSGLRLDRYIRDNFVQFAKRVIFRRIEAVMDTGRITDDYYDSFQDNKPEMRNIEIYVALSTNRGLSFGQRHYRNLGICGQNNKVIEWRNLGSGNSVLVEIGTSSLHKLQLYDMRVEVE